jgi:hypothetical protein
MSCVASRGSSRPRTSTSSPPGPGLRITPTELILGYRKNARRGSLAGLSARVEDSGTQAQNDVRRIHVIIEGPGTAVVRTKKAKAAFLVRGILSHAWQHDHLCRIHFAIESLSPTGHGFLLTNHK